MHEPRASCVVLRASPHGAKQSWHEAVSGTLVPAATHEEVDGRITPSSGLQVVDHECPGAERGTSCGLDWCPRDAHQARGSFETPAKHRIDLEPGAPREQFSHVLERLDQILYDTFADLKAAREIEDARILGFVSGLSDETIGGTLRYRNMAGESHETPLAWVLAHFFNHQTHHRGQTHGMLSGTSVAPPSLDLIYFLRQDSA